MIQDLFRAFVQRLMHDKILMAIVVIGIAGIWFSSASPPQENPEKTGSRRGTHAKPGAADGGDQAPAKAGNPPQSQNQAHKPAEQSAQPAPGGLTPKLAADFVHWWITKAMDYQMATAVANHKEADAWMLPEAKKAFEDMYWNVGVQQGIASGNTVGSFQPVSIQPVATNPDGSVVVTVTGTLVMQMSGQQPASQQLTMDFLVKKAGDGCRVAAFFNRAVSAVQQQ